MILGGLALAFSRLIDNSVVVLENIFRHMELGEPPEVAAERGGSEVALPVLAATLTTAIVFFPVIFLYGVSRFLFMRAGAGGGAFAVRLLFRGDDGRAPVLRQTDQGSTVHPQHAPRAGRKRWRPGGGASISGSTAASRPCSTATRATLSTRAAAARRDGARHHRDFHSEPRAVSAGGQVLLSPHRSQPVRHQSQGPDRHAPGADRPAGGQGRADRARGRAGEGLRKSSSPTSASRRDSPPSTRPTPARTPPLCRWG